MGSPVSPQQLEGHRYDPGGGLDITWTRKLEHVCRCVVCDLVHLCCVCHVRVHVLCMSMCVCAVCHHVHVTVVCACMFVLCVYGA